jgi:hypothetical protein
MMRPELMPAHLDPRRRLTADRFAAITALLEAPLVEARGIDRDEARRIGYLALYRHRRRR